MPHRKISILQKILLPLLIVMSLQSALIYGAIAFGGTLSQMRDNAFDIFNKKVSSRQNMLENEMVQRWSNLDESVGKITDRTQALLDLNSYTYSDLVPQSTSSNALLTELTDDIVYLLRKNSVTGAFIVLNGTGGGKKSGLYFRDSDPGSNPNGYSDLLIERAPSSITKKLGIPLDTFWLPSFDLEESSRNNDFYYKPYYAALEHPDADYDDLAYWSPTFQLGDDPLEIITYSVPLISESGTVFGVLGIEVSVEYLSGLLPSNELNGGSKDGYMLAVCNKSEANLLSRSYSTLMCNGAFYSPIFRSDTSFLLDKAMDDKQNLVMLDQGTFHDRILTRMDPLQLYNSNTPFENEQWALIGLIAEDELLADSQNLGRLILLLWLISTVIGIVGIIFSASMIAHPIGMLAKKVRQHNPDTAISLDRIHIAEIDELLDSIEFLSRQVIDSSSKLSKILELTGVSSGAFEYNYAMPDYIFCTSGFFEVLNLKDIKLEDNHLPTPLFKQYLDEVHKNLEEASEDQTLNIYRIETESQTRWVRLKLVYNENGVLGAVTDVTQETLERKRMEHDRDYDLLTNLFNRRAFHVRMVTLFSEPQELRCGAVLMMDLDNLKFVNDTYGHDYGDEYIRSAAGVLKKYSGSQAVVSRLSGDEFVVFLYGYNQKQSIREVCAAIQDGMRNTMIYLPDHTQMQIRASAGIAWYPDDSVSYEDLIRFSDFAMYMVKKNHKGNFTEFNIESYHKDSYLLYCREELNTIIEQSLVRFQFQPIVDAHTGEVFAFEALMRPQTENIKTPLDLLSLARSQSKLSQIERLTFFCALKSFDESPISHSACKLFVNSISNQVMDETSLTELMEKYPAHLSRVVVELTEEERPEEKYNQIKQKYIKKWDAQLALDDFGVGYNGETLLLNLSPNFIKLDMSIVQTVHTDSNRRQILNNLVAYSQSRGIKVIAEGVECVEEMQVLIEAGVDYLQGYYLGKPSYNPDLTMERRKAEILSINSAYHRVDPGNSSN